MIHTSTEYKKAIRGNREFCTKDTIAFSDGTEIPLETGDFVSYSINEATSNPGKFEIGGAVIKEYSVTLNNADGKFDKYDFEGADITAKVGIKLENGAWEILSKGRYRVVSAKSLELTIQVKAYDSMLFFDRPYSESTLSYPTTIRQIVQDACNVCEIVYDDSSMEMPDYGVKERPNAKALTFRDIISYCAQIMGCYAKINHMDKLVFGWYGFENLPKALDGGDFSGDNSPYGPGDVADGGNFKDYTSGYVHDGGTFRDAEKYHHFYNMKSQNINTDDIVITGVLVSAETEGNQKESYLCGAEEYALEIADNPLIQKGKVQQAAEHIGLKVVGNRFRPMSIEIQSDPSVEAGDVAVVTDRRQRTYRTVITNTTFSFGGGQKIECSAETPTEKSYTKYGAVTKILAKAEKQTGQKLSAYDIAIKQMNQLAANTMGFYSTTIRQMDGSVLAYRHDKPELSESNVVYKSGIDGFFVTQEYQGTDEATTAADKWKAGFDANGDAVLNILSVIGINFSWARGGELILGGGDGEGGVMIVKDASGAEIVRCDINGITATKGKFSGDLEAAGGTFEGELKAATGTFSGELKAARGTFEGELKGAAGTFTGELRAATGTFLGELQGATGTFTGSLLTGNERTNIEISNGRIHGTSHGTEVGNIEFDKKNENKLILEAYGTDGEIDLKCRKIYTTDSQGNEVRASTKDVKVLTDAVYSGNSLTKYYTTLHFVNGLLVSTLQSGGSSGGDELEI